MTAYLSPSPFLHFDDNAGNNLSGGKLFTYLSKTTTKANTFVDSSGTTPNTNPIILDSRGEADVFLPPGQLFTYVLSPATDTDPPSNPIKVVDDIGAGGAVASINFANDTGIANALIASVANIPALFDGLAVTVEVAVTNTGPATFNLNGLGANPVVVQSGAGLLGQELLAGGQYLLQFTGTSWQILGLSVSPGLQLTATEIAASVTPTNYGYPPGCPRRYGAVGNGIADDTAAVQKAINAGPLYWGWYGDNYAVTSVIWPASGLSVAHFNGSELTGIAAVATTCISQIKSNFTTFYDYAVNGGSFGGVTPNSNYLCATWWFNGHITASPTGAPDGASQFNTFYGMQHISCVRGLVYGQLPGSASGSTIVHSENKIYGFQTDGVSNPIYVNSGSGFLHTYGSTFFRDASTWTTPTLPSTARAIENLLGNLYVHGGEIIASNSQLGFACDLTAATIVDNAYLELSAPVQILGDNVRFINCRGQVLNQGVSMFKINGVAGIMSLTSCNFFRPAGLGVTDRTAFCDGSAVPTFEVISNNNVFQEWGFLQNQANVKLIQGCSGRYYKTQYNLTAADANLYVLDDPRISIFPQNLVDDSGYTTTGWTKTDSGGSGTLSITTAAGPPSFLASQLQIANGTGQSSVLSGDQTSLTTIKATMLRVVPTETYWLSGWLNFTAGGTTAQLVVSFFDLTGAAVSTVVAANNTSIGSGGWVFVEGGIPVPATAAYAAEGVIVNTGTLKFVRIRLQRAWT